MNHIQQLAQAEARTYDLQSDSSGNWDLKVSNNLSAGAHVVTVEDEKGNLDQAIMYVIKETKVETGAQAGVPGEQILIDRITKTVPDNLFLPIGLLALLILLLSILLLAMARKAQKNQEEKEKREMNEMLMTKKPFHHYIKLAVIVCAIALFTLIGVGIWLNRETNFLSRFFSPSPASQVIDEIKGQVIDPLNKTGIAGVDLVSGQTSIRTSGSGSYIFSMVNSADGIRLTHPALLRPLKILPVNQDKQQKIDIYFNDQMFATLTRVLDAEARGRLGEIYTKYLSTDITNKITADVFAQKYTNTLTAGNITDQEIVIKNMKVADNYVIDKYAVGIPKAVVMTLVINDTDTVYALQEISGKWYLVK